LKGAGRDVWREDICEVLRGEGMEGLVGEEEEFVSDAGLDWEPVEVDESGGDVLPGLGACENPGS